jgi:hypothetical protein
MLYRGLIAVNSESCTQPTFYVDRTLNFIGVNLPIPKVPFMLYHPNTYRLYETVLMSDTRGRAVD